MDMKFPMDKDEDDEEDDDEVVLDEHSLIPEASIKVVLKSNTNQGNLERAKFIAYYFLGQYQILMEAANDLQTMLGGEGDDAAEIPESSDQEE